MIMKPKSKKFCFKKLFVFGLLMLALQLMTFMGYAPLEMEVIENLENEEQKAEILETPYSEYAMLYSYDYDEYYSPDSPDETPMSRVFGEHVSLLVGLIAVAAVIAGNFRLKTVSKTVALGCASFTALSFIFFFTFALIDSNWWYTKYSLFECSSLMFGLMVIGVGAAVTVAAFFCDPVLEAVSKKVEARRWKVYEQKRQAEREA